MDYRQLTMDVLTENGIILFDTLEDEPLDYDSLTFISIVVTIENKLGFEVADELLKNYPVTYSEWVDFIKNAVELHEMEDGDEEDDEEDDE